MIAIFRPLIPYAAQHNMRLVLLNLRDYPGSSKYSDEELRIFQNPDSALCAVRNLGHEFALFLKVFASENNIPRVRAGSLGAKKGGISIVAWSLGTATLMSMIAHFETYDEVMKTFLASYIRTVIIYGMLSLVVYSMLKNENCTP
jgi:hypothetical protein